MPNEQSRFNAGNNFSRTYAPVKKHPVSSASINRSSDDPQPEQYEPFPLPTKEAIMKMPPFAGLTLKSIYLVTTPLQAKKALDDLIRCKVVGFDTESRPTFRKGEISEGPHVLQFATSDRAYIFQTHHTDCTPIITDILRSPHIIKAGFGLGDDLKRIAEKFSIIQKGIIDLNHTFRLHFHQRNSIGAKGAIAFLFNRRFIKSHKATTSNWSNTELSEPQLLYAANDAFAAFVVYEALQKHGIIVSQ